MNEQPNKYDIPSFITPIIDYDRAVELLHIKDSCYRNLNLKLLKDNLIIKNGIYEKLPVNTTDEDKNKIKNKILSVNSVQEYKEKIYEQRRNEFFKLDERHYPMTFRQYTKYIYKPNYTFEHYLDEFYKENVR